MDRCLVDSRIWSRRSDQAGFLQRPRSAVPRLFLFCTSPPPFPLDFVLLRAGFSLQCRLVPCSAILIRSNAPSAHGQGRARPSLLRLSCEGTLCRPLISPAFRSPSRLALDAAVVVTNIFHNYGTDLTVSKCVVDFGNSDDDVLVCIDDICKVILGVLFRTSRIR